MGISGGPSHRMISAASSAIKAKAKFQEQINILSSLPKISRSSSGQGCSVHKRKGGKPIRKALVKDAYREFT